MADRNKTKHVALILGYYDYRIHLGIVRYARQAGWVIDAVAIAGNVPTWWHGDGMITFHRNNPDILDKIENEHVPVVDLTVPTEEHPLPAVIHDNVAIGRMAGLHLCSLGYEHVGYANIGDHPNDVDRMNGLRAVVTEKRRTFHPLSFKRLRKELAALPLPVAILFPNDSLAVHGVRICNELGLNVPRDVAILGVDNNPLECEQVKVSISSVDSDFESIGFEAAKALNALMNGEEAPMTPIKVPPKEVVVRQSTDSLAISHPAVRRAMTILRDQFPERVDLNHVARRAGMCRRRLDDAFRTHVGHSMCEELMQLRLRDALQLLRTSSEKLSQVAYLSGFSSAESMHRVFKRELGNSPGHFRKRPEN